MNKTINIDGLHHYSISTKGQVFLGDQKIKGCLAEQNIVIIPLTPKRHKIPKPFYLQNLYFKTYGKHLPKCAIDSYAPTKEPIEFRSVLLTDKNKDKITFTCIDHAANFLSISIKALISAIKNKNQIKGFNIFGTRNRYNEYSLLAETDKQ